MSQTLVVRSASATAAALMVGGFMIGLASLKFAYSPGLRMPDPPPLTIVTPAPPPPPPPVDHRTLQPPAPVDPGPIVSQQPIDSTAQPTETTAPVAPTSEPGPVEIVDPHWTHRPSDLGRYYPARALMRGIEGQVTLTCLVRADGTLDCAIAAETPSGWGFGQAALRISRDYAMTPATRDGIAVEARYRMRVPFAIN
jgi:periplasmic protein TonB